MVLYSFQTAILSYIDVVFSFFSEEGPKAPNGYESITKMVEHIKSLQEEKIKIVNQVETCQVCRFQSLTPKTSSIQLPIIHNFSN